MATDNHVYGTVQGGTSLTAPQADLTERLVSNVDNYGFLITNPLLNKNHRLAKMGCYFVAKNLAQGTAITGHAAATAYDATKPSIHIANGAAVGDNAAGGKYIYVDYLKLTFVTPGTNGTNKMYSLAIDVAGSAVSSGGTAAVTKNVHMLSNNTSVATITAGAVVAATASANKRIIDDGFIRSTIVVAYDTAKFNFGGDTQPAKSSLLSSSTAQSHFSETCPPWIIPPGCVGLFHLQAASESVAATFEYELGYWEF